MEIFTPSVGYPLRSSMGLVGGSSRSWDAGPLQPGAEYFWRVTVMDCDTPGPVSALEDFFTGPICPDSTDATYLEPVLLRPFDGEIVRSTMLMTSDDVEFLSPSVWLYWDDPSACLPPDGYAIQISRDRTFRDEARDEGTTDLEPGTTIRANFWWWFKTFGSEWHDCERIYWRVLIGRLGTYDAASDEERYAGVHAFSETWSFVINTSGLLCGFDGGHWITPIPPERWFPFIPPSEPSIPRATVIEDAVCWSGPSMEYVILDYLTPGQELEIRGRDQANSWWYVDDPAIHKACWVYGEHVQTSGDLSQVPVQQAPPVPTRTPTNPPPVSCGQYADPTSCANNQACWWDSNVPPNGVCKNK